LKVRFRKRSLDVRSIREISTHQAPEPWPDGVEVAFFDVVWVAHEGKIADGKTGEPKKRCDSMTFSTNSSSLNAGRYEMI